MADKPIRSIVKAFSYRVTGTFVTTLISLFIIGDFKFALSIGLLDLVMKTLTYFIHERIWNKIKFGRVEEPEYHI